MITEYYSETELVNELNLACDKLESMKNGWLGQKLLRLFKKSRTGGKYFQDFTLNKQKYSAEIAWDSNSKQGYYYFNIITYIETKCGKLKISFSNKYSPIFVYSPHYRKRFKERAQQMCCFTQLLEYVPYIRNKKEYELVDIGEDIVISRRGKIEKRLSFWITTLSKDMCTSKNYQELLSRVGKQIDNDDVYEWK